MLGLVEELLPGVLGGDEGESAELEGASVDEGEVVVTAMVGGAVADADGGVEEERGVDVHASADLEAADAAVWAWELLVFVEAEAGGARRFGALDDVGGEEALVDQWEEDGLPGAWLVRG